MMMITEVYMGLKHPELAANHDTIIEKKNEDEKRKVTNITETTKLKKKMG